MTVRQFEEFLAHDRLSPWGEDRADWRNAMLCMMVASACGSKTAKMSDFMLSDDPDKKEQPEDEKDAAMRAKFEGFLKVVESNGDKRGKTDSDPGAERPQVHKAADTGSDAP